MSDQLATLGTNGHMLQCATIDSLPFELYLQIFEFCRLDDEYDWSHCRRWYRLVHVCRKWRYIILESASHLKLRLLCDYATPVERMLRHSPPLPLIVTFDLGSFTSSSHRENILLALQQNDRVSSIIIWKWSLDDVEMLRAIDKSFPVLEALSLCSNEDYATQVVPTNFMAPHLRFLRIRNVAFTAVSSFLTSATNLTTLHLEFIPRRGNFSPDSLVEVISNMSRLENLSISLEYIFRSNQGTELQPTQTTRIVLPSLWRFLYFGHPTYIENLLALISTPLLQYFSVSVYRQRTIAFPRLSEFLGTFENLNFSIAEVSLTASTYTSDTSIAYQPTQSSSSLPYFIFCFINVPFRSDQVASLAQLCSAIAPTLPIIRGLDLKLDRELEEDDFEIDTELWHALFRSFGDVTTLWMDITLSAELSYALQHDDRAMARELLPMLSKLIVVSENNRVHKPLVAFILAHRLSRYRVDGIDLQLIKQRPRLFPNPCSYYLLPLF